MVIMFFPAIIVASIPLIPIGYLVIVAFRLDPDIEEHRLLAIGISFGIAVLLYKYKIFYFNKLYRWFYRAVVWLVGGREMLDKDD
jgi:hypothetical protein